MKILIALDNSDFSETAFQHVLQDSTLPLDCQFRVLTVIESSIAMYPMIGFCDISLCELENEAFHDSTQRINEWVRMLKTQYPQAAAVGEIRYGSAADQILSAAEEWDADLIVVGSHGRRDFSHLRIGSVAEKVARDAACSVEVVRKSLEVASAADRKNVVAGSTQES